MVRRELDRTAVLLRPHGALCDELGVRVTDTEVLEKIGSALGTTVDVMAKELAVARGFAAPVTSVFCASNDARAEAAIIDWLALYAEVTGPAGSMVAFDQPPVAWHAAAQRMTAVVEAARRAKAAHDSGMAAPSHTGGPTGDDTFKAGWFKPVPTAGRIDLGFAAGGDMLTPLSTVEFARAESIATRGDTPLAEVRRLCNMPGAIGAGCFAYIFSAGCAKGAVPKGIAASVVDARYQLLA